MWATIPLSAPTPLAAKNFVLEYDMNYESKGDWVDPRNVYRPDKTCLGIKFRCSEINTYGDVSSYEFCYNCNYNSWKVNKINFPSSTLIDFGDLDKDAFRLRIIAYDDIFAIYADNELLTVFQDDEITGEDNFILVNDAYIFVDNLQFWNLDQVDEDSLFGNVPEETSAEPTPIVNELSKKGYLLYDTVMVYMAENNPTFEDNFETRNYDWGMFSFGDEGLSTNSRIYNLVQNGQLQITADTGSFWCINPAIDFDARNFIIRYSISPQAGFRDFRISLRGTRLWGGTFYEPINTYDINITKNSLGTSNIPYKYVEFYDPLKMYDLLIVAKDNIVVVFIDGSPIIYTESAPAAGKFNIPIQSIRGLKNGEDIMYFDDFRFWNMDGIDL